MVTPFGLVAKSARETLKAGAAAAGTFSFQVMNSGEMSDISEYRSGRYRLGSNYFTVDMITLDIQE